MGFARAALALRPESVGAWLQLSDALQNTNHFSEALAAHRTAVQLDPDNTLAHLHLGYTLVRQGQLEAALDSFRTAVRLDPKSARAYHAMGYVLERMDKAEQAAAAWTTATQLDAGSAVYHTRLGHSLTNAQQWDAAIATWKTVTELDPASGDAFSFLGNALLQSGQATKAVDAYRLATSAEPGAGEFVQNLFHALHEQNQSDQIVDFCSSRLNADTHLTIQRNIIAVAARFEGILDQLATLYPDNALVLAEVARQKANSNSPETARTAETAYNRACELLKQQLVADPKDSAVANVLAGTLLQPDPVDWTPLRPVNFVSTAGANLTVLPDQSILAGGPNSHRDSYTVEFATPAGQIMHPTGSPHTSLTAQRWTRPADARRRCLSDCGAGYDVAPDGQKSRARRAVWGQV